MKSWAYSVDQVKALCLAKSGEDLGLDDVADYACDADGMFWVRIAARPVAAQEVAYESKGDAWQKCLAEVKALFSAEFSFELEDLKDESDPFYEAEGTQWQTGQHHHRWMWSGPWSATSRTGSISPRTSTLFPIRAPETSPKQ